MHHCKDLFAVWGKTFLNYCISVAVGAGYGDGVKTLKKFRHIFSIVIARKKREMGGGGVLHLFHTLTLTPRKDGLTVKHLDADRQEKGGNSVSHSGCLSLPPPPEPIPDIIFPLPLSPLLFSLTLFSHLFKNHFISDAFIHFHYLYV